MTVVDADLVGDGSGGSFVVAGEQHRGQARARGARVIASALVGLTVSATTSSGADGAVPADEDRGVAERLGVVLGGSQFGGERHGPVGEEPFAAGDHAVAVDDALDAEAFEVGEALDGGQAADAVAGGGGDGLGDGVLGGVLEGTDEAEHLVAVGAVDGDDVDERHAAGGDGAGLVEHDGVDLSGRFEDLWSLDEDPELGAAAGADEQRGRGGETEGAGAGDDQHGDGGGERGGGGLAGPEPEPEGPDGEGDDDGDEHGGDLVGEPLHGGLAVLGVGDEPGDLGEGGVGADAGGPDDEAAAGVDGGAGDGVAGRDLDRDRFAGEQRRVDGRRCLPRRRRRWRPSRRGGRRTGRRRRARRSGCGPRRRRGGRRRPWRPCRAALAGRHRSVRLARASK